MIWLLIAMTSVQGGAALAKGLFPVLGIAGTTSIRLMTSALMLLIFFRPWRQQLSRTQVKSIALYGASLGLMNFLFYFALKTLPLGIAVALEFTGPLAVALGSSRKPIDFLWASLAAAGVVLVLPIHSFSGAYDFTGVFYALGAGLCWALYIIFGNRSGNTIQGGTAVSWGVLVAAVVAAPLGVFEVGTKLLDPSILPLGFALGLFSSALPYALEMIALKKIERKTFAILMSLEPAIGAVWGVFTLHENLALMQYLAIILIMIASWGSARNKPTLL